MSPSTRRSRDEFEAWKERSLEDVELEYLYVDASNFRYHPRGLVAERKCYSAVLTESWGELNPS